jgi:hypothetical protein
MISPRWHNRAGHDGDIRFRRMLGLSAVVHLMLLAFFIYSTNVPAPKWTFGPVYSVQLVSLLPRFPWRSCSRGRRRPPSSSGSRWKQRPQFRSRRRRCRKNRAPPLKKPWMRSEIKSMRRQSRRRRQVPRRCKQMGRPARPTPVGGWTPIMRRSGRGSADSGRCPRRFFPKAMWKPSSTQGSCATARWWVSILKKGPATVILMNPPSGPLKRPAAMDPRRQHRNRHPLPFRRIPLIRRIGKKPFFTGYAIKLSENNMI